MQIVLGPLSHCCIRVRPDADAVGIYLVLDLGWLQQSPQHRRRREVGDGERVADEIRAALPLLLDPVERGVHGGAIGLEFRIADLVTKALFRQDQDIALRVLTTGMADKAYQTLRPLGRIFPAYYPPA